MVEALEWFSREIPAYYLQVSGVDRRLLDGIALPGLKVLDVGCGIHLYDDVWMALRGADVTGIDYDEEMIRAAGERLKDADGRGFIDGLAIRVETGDGRHLDFDDCTFDVVTSFSAIEHMPSGADRLAAVREMSRVVKRGGVVVLTGPNFLPLPVTLLSRLFFRRVKQFEHRYTPWELKRMLISSGLDIERFDAESLYTIDERLVRTRFPWLKSVPMSFFKPLSLLLRRFNSSRRLKFLGMRIGYRARKP
ncbi:MAG: class I SAM-dependent methyltransferase [Actinomycetota bacterium]